MRYVFADTWYWVALANPEDDCYKSAIMLKGQLGNAIIVVTEEVLGEFLTYMGGKGEYLRNKASSVVETIKNNPNVTVVSQSSDSFTKGSVLFKDRPDKRYSYVDCVSMSTMTEMAISVVITDDDHFSQEGFTKIP